MSGDYAREELVEALRRSKQLFGPLYPVLKDQKGNIIDGFTRLRADPNWPSTTVSLRDPSHLHILRLVSNWVRREMTAEEKANALGLIAERTGWTPREIAENLGISYRAVMKYIPDKYKERPGAGGPRPQVEVQEEVVEEPAQVEEELEEVPERVARRATQEADIATFTCPVCRQSFLIVHVEPTGMHKLRPLKKVVRD